MADDAANNNTDAGNGQGTDQNQNNGDDQNQNSGDDQNQNSGDDQNQNSGNDQNQNSGDDQNQDQGAPETYEQFKLPDGAEANTELLGEFSTVAKALNLSQESAQKFVDLVPKYAEVFQKQQTEAWDKTRDKWVSDLKADADLGGDKFKATVESANRVLRNYGGSELIKFLDSSGLGDNVDLVKMLVKLDRALGEDHIVDGGASNIQDDKTQAQRMYPGSS